VPAERADRGVQRSIVLVGFMAAGKSRIGRLLAQRLRLPFVDTDHAIEESYRLTVADIFRERGEAEFREAERALIARLVSEEPKVIALGGGAFVNPRNRDALNSGAWTVWLDPPFDVILPRLRRSAERPLASSRSEDELRALWNERRQYYAQAQLRIETSDADPARIVDRIIQELGRR
jgi:shikimate kinase